MMKDLFKIRIFVGMACVFFILGCSEDGSNDINDPNNPNGLSDNRRSEAYDLSRQWSDKINTLNFIEIGNTHAGESGRVATSDGSLHISVNGLEINLVSSGGYVCNALGDMGWFGFNGHINVPNSLREADFIREEEREIMGSIVEIDAIVEMDTTYVTRDTTYTVTVTVIPELEEILAATGLSVNDFEVDNPEVIDYNDIRVRGQISLNIEGFLFVVSIHTPVDLGSSSVTVKHSYYVEHANNISFADGVYEVNYLGLLRAFTYSEEGQFVSLDHTTTGSISSTGSCR